MFKKSRFIFNANAALAQLGINPLSISNDFRRETLMKCMEAGRAPKEAACFIYHEMGSTHQTTGAEAIIRTWEDKGLVDGAWRKTLFSKVGSG